MQMTSECIESVFEKTKDVEFEIILVDNASTDGSKEKFSNDGRIKYIYSAENLGFGGGNNLGYKHSTGDYIFLLNSDTLLVNNAIKEFYDYMQYAPQSVGCVGCVLQDKNGKRMHSYHSAFPSLGWIFKEILSYSIPKLYNPYNVRERMQAKDHYPQKVAVITGADLFIRRNVIETCGMFDTDFFMYYEETEMQHRFQKAGFDSFVIDTPQIIHLAGYSSKNKKSVLQKMKMPLRSRFIYAKKIFSRKEYIMFRLIHLIMVPRILLSLSTWNEKKETLKIIFG
jgi:GT2 family glycosyltransferase